MKRKLVGNNNFLKEFNKRLILDLIRVNKKISKADLAKITGLSPTATGVITSGLLKEGYIHETGIGESSGGRRPVLLELKPYSYYSVGVDIDASITLILVDITGETVFEQVLNFPKPAEAKKVVECVEEAIQHCLKIHSIDLKKLLGIGISVPGLVDEKTQSVVLAPNLQWENVGIKKYLKKLKGVPIYIENESMSSAICENWIGLCQGINDFVCINLKTGIGAGIFTGGIPYKGAGGSAGEIGHIIVSENGPQCGCGNKGCLETIASTTHLVKKAQQLVEKGEYKGNHLPADTSNMCIYDIIHAAKSGDVTAREILEDSGKYIGVAVSTVVNMLNPSKIVLGKDFVKFSDMVMDKVTSTVVSKALKPSVSRVEIVPSFIGDKSSALGAAIIPLKVLFGK